MRIVDLDASSRKNLLDELLKRSPNHYGAYGEQVNAILSEVKEKGDEALFAYTKRFDGAHITRETFKVTQSEIEEAYRQVVA